MCDVMGGGRGRRGFRMGARGGARGCGMMGSTCKGDHNQHVREEDCGGGEVDMRASTPPVSSVQPLTLTHLQVPAGTVGGRMAGTWKPSRSSAALRLSAACAGECVRSGVGVQGWGGGGGGGMLSRTQWAGTTHGWTHTGAVSRVCYKCVCHVCVTNVRVTCRSRVHEPGASRVHTPVEILMTAHVSRMHAC